MGLFKLSKTQKIGLFVVLVLIGAYTLINYLRGEDIFKRNNKYYTTIESVEGLTASSPVYIRGLKVGMIEQIKYNASNDYFVAKINVKADYEISKNSIIEVYSSDIMGGKAIRIALGDSTAIAKDGDTLKSTTIPDMMSLLSKGIGPMGEQVSQVLTNMNKALVNINEILDSSAKHNIASSLANLNKSLKNAEKLTASLNDMTPALKSIVANFDTLSTTLSGEGENFSKLVDNLNRISADLANADIDATIASIKSLVDKLQNPEGSVGRLLSTPSMHDSVDTLIKNLNTFVEKMTENPKKFIKISVF